MNLGHIPTSKKPFPGGLGSKIWLLCWKQKTSHTRYSFAIILSSTLLVLILSDFPPFIIFNPSNQCKTMLFYCFMVLSNCTFSMFLCNQMRHRIPTTWVIFHLLPMIPNEMLHILWASLSVCKVKFELWTKPDCTSQVTL